MSYLTDNMLRNVIDVPVALPATRVSANKWIVISTIKVANQVKAEFNWLLLQLLEAIDPKDETVLDLNDSCNPADIGLINSNYGLAYVGIVKDLSGSSLNTNTLQFIGTTNDVLTISNRGVVQRDPTTVLTIDTPGNYSFVLVNNCSEIDLRLLTAGMIRVNAS